MKENEKQKESNLVLRGFLERKGYKLRFTDLYEVFFSAIILCKIDDLTNANAVEVTLAMSDIFSKLDKEDWTKQTVFTRERMQENIADTINHLFGAELIQRPLELYHA